MKDGKALAVQQNIRHAASGATLLACAMSVHAQSSVTLFGMMDVGMSYVSNEGGHSILKFDEGIYTPSLFGLCGDEDMGGGRHAVSNCSISFRQLTAGRSVTGCSDVVPTSGSARTAGRTRGSTARSDRTALPTARTRQSHA